MIAANEKPTFRVRLLVAYDGAAFSGFARNVGVATVAGTLEAHLERVLGHPVSITGAGRTDRGVHAWGQVVTFDTTTVDLDLDRLARSINGVCGPAISVRDATVVPHDFDARFSATWRRYRYTIWTAAAPNPFLGAYSWHVPQALDVAAMEAAGVHLLGQHDFSSFCRRPPVMPGREPASLERTVTELGWTRPDTDVLRFEITARAFCHQMVRSITGTLVDVGLGRLGVADMPAIISAGDRARAGRLAPPQGLCLHAVGY